MVKYLFMVAPIFVQCLENELHNSKGTQFAHIIWLTVKAGTQERGTEDAKNAKMNAHAHIVQEHMVIGATVKSTR